MSMTIVEEAADLSTPSGSMRAVILRPGPSGKYPGVILWSEIFQITSPVRRTAALIAGMGFVVLVPEVYHELMPGPGVVLAYDQAGADRGNACKTEKELSSYDADATACVEFLKAHPACSGRI